MNTREIHEHLRQCYVENKEFLEIIKLLDHVEKHGYEKRTQQLKILDDIILVIENEDSSSHAECIYFVIWLTQLQDDKKLPFFNDSQFNVVTRLLQINLEKCHNLELVSKILTVFCGLFSKYPTNATKHMHILNTILEYISWERTVDVLVSAVRCLDVLIGFISCPPSPVEQTNCGEKILEKILALFYSIDSMPLIDSEVLPTFLIHSLQIVHRTMLMTPVFAKQHIPELLGLARSYLHFGIDANTIPALPQKVYMSQQAVYESAEEFENNMSSEKARNFGGKTLKNRKPRLKSNTGDLGVTNTGPEAKVTLLSMDMKTSDSEPSEQECSGNRVLFERHRVAKIRLASISIIGAIVKTLERRFLYGYWHALFPSGTGESQDNLLYIAQHDPNMRCRCLALQVCAQVLYGSKGFLQQAETNANRCPMTFIPFSLSLGFTVVAIYRALSIILTTESSMPVLTQALKCLAVLVQATPFQKLEKGFVRGFVKHVKPLIYHRDAAIQVSSLMVLEFLISSTDTTSEIPEALGLPQPKGARNNQFVMNNSHPLREEEHDIIDDEEFVDSETEEDVNKEIATNFPTSEKKEKVVKNDNSWLILRVLYNLKDHDKSSVATSVRIESLQVLIAMSVHFDMLKSHLPEVAGALQRLLTNPLPDIRTYAARCLDSCAFQISRQIVENGYSSEANTYEQFWSDIIPIILERIERDHNEINAVRITLCDALSNIGAVMFENCSNSMQIAILSFLSGVSSDCSEEAILRATAVRALAVYVLYPSLRCDLVFVENTADLALRLVTDSNLLVRVKTFWALGNISDALVGKTGNPNANQERISDELLFRMIKVSTMACSDNDKVRCNSVRTLGNLLSLLKEEHLQMDKPNMNWRDLFEKAICKLADCIRSSGNAKVKWNSCYAISNIMRNRVIFSIPDLLNWQNTLYPALSNVIVHHANFKVRINAASAITNIGERQHFGNYFEKLWSSILEALEQSHNLDSFHEYNHRDNLQEQLCLALTHMVNCSATEDWPLMKRHLSIKEEIIRSTWRRVVLRTVPEKAAPLMACSFVLIERVKDQQHITIEQKMANEYLSAIFAID
ncbi:HEAT repeat-containing protein 6 [Haematobia irritans]|uniref:HEAT repeat-containing protein 6 n=1 Tax=Haematobia irritans TaxID=7368 RepID=UPI003F501943